MPWVRSVLGPKCPRSEVSVLLICAVSLRGAGTVVGVGSLLQELAAAVNDATLCHMIKHDDIFSGEGASLPSPISLQPRITFQCARKTVYHMPRPVAASVWSLLQRQLPSQAVELLSTMPQYSRCCEFRPELWPKWQWMEEAREEVTSLNKLREYVALLIYYMQLVIIVYALTVMN